MEWTYQIQLINFWENVLEILGVGKGEGFGKGEGREKLFRVHLDGVVVGVELGRNDGYGISG